MAAVDSPAPPIRKLRLFKLVPSAFYIKSINLKSTTSNNHTLHCNINHNNAISITVVQTKNPTNINRSRFMSLNLNKQKGYDTPADYNINKNQYVIALLIVVATSFNIAFSMPNGTTIEPLNKLNELTPAIEATINYVINFLLS